MKNYIYSILAFALLISGCKGKEEAKKEEEKKESQTVSVSMASIKETGIESVETAYTSINGYLSAPARIIPNPDEEAIVGSLVKGRVKKVFFNPGNFVKQGQSLLELEGLEIGEIKSCYRKAKAQLDYTESVYKRQKSLNEQNVSSAKLLTESKAEYDKALAEFKAEDEKIHSIGLSDEECLDNSSNHSSGIVAIKAPISGIISERNVIIGQLVDENATAFKIMNISQLWVEAQVYEKDIPAVSGVSECSFISPVFPNAAFGGKIFFVSQIVDEKTRTIILKASVANSSGKLKPQMFGELKIPVNKNSKAIVVPAEAVINDNGKYYVFVQTGDSTFEKRDVKIGIKDDKFLEISEGVKEKEKIVVKGAFYLKSELLKSSFGGEE